jgi:hypothetical protein
MLSHVLLDWRHLSAAMCDMPAQKIAHGLPRAYTSHIPQLDRDHHPFANSMFMAGAGFKAGFIYQYPRASWATLFPKLYGTVRSRQWR